jgi:hypothetical protein
MHERYLKASSREEKGRLIDELVELTGYHRNHAKVLLRHGPPAGRGVYRPGRVVEYGPRVTAAPEIAAEATGWICGKRPVWALPELVPALEREGALRLTPQVREQLLGISAATIDRRLAAAKRRARPRGLATTKPGSLLKRQIPVRTYTPWDEQSPGFLEIDLVAHCGDTTAGTYCCTLDAVDVATGWTECEPVPNRGQAAVFEALEDVRRRLPFPLLGIDSDNGTEFINAHLLRYCEAEGLTFTRCREYRKNDQAHVEQKNYTHVRQLVGYGRYEGEAAVERLRAIYNPSRIWSNGYLPMMKLVGKERDGARVRKRYDEPKTPHRRVLEAGVAAQASLLSFEQLLTELGPLGLKRRLDTERERLWALSVRAAAVGPAIAVG